MSHLQKKFAVKNFYVVLLLIFYSFNACAIVPKSDTTQSKKPHKISKKEFLRQYGKDDSTTALIKYYFRERNGSKRATLVTSAITALSGIAVNNIINNKSSAGHVVALGTGLLLIFIAFASAIVMAVQIIMFIRTSRKKLYKMLSDYNKGLPLPSKITRSRPYKKQYAKEKMRRDK